MNCQQCQPNHVLNEKQSHCSCSCHKSMYIPTGQHVIALFDIGIDTQDSRLFFAKIHANKTMIRFAVEHDGLDEFITFMKNQIESIVLASLEENHQSKVVQSKDEKLTDLFNANEIK